MIVVCGEALVDLVPAAGGVGHVARPGGSPANVATALGRLGVHAALLARLSDDHFGQMIRRHLLESHVDLSLTTDVHERTTVAMVHLAASGDAGYTFFIEGGSDDTWSATTLPPLPPEASALHISGSLALSVPSMGEAVETLLAAEHGRRVVTFDPNPRPFLTPDVPALRAKLERWLAYADVVKVSSEDLAWTHPGESIEDVATRWRAAGPALVVVTRGGEGVYALGSHGSTELPALAIELVDTVGAGDAFTAGLLASLHHDGLLSQDGLRWMNRADLDRSLAYAQRVASITCGRVGADPPWLTDLVA